ncbi:MAG: hypothetical protein ACRD4S_01645 [Candidatus Acidiferrales bacterium]
MKRVINAARSWDAFATLAVANAGNGAPNSAAMGKRRPQTARSVALAKAEGRRNTVMKRRANKPILYISARIVVARS